MLQNSQFGQLQRKQLKLVTNYFHSLQHIKKFHLKHLNMLLKSQQKLFQLNKSTNQLHSHLPMLERALRHTQPPVNILIADLELLHKTSITMVKNGNPLNVAVSLTPQSLLLQPTQQLI